MVSTRLERIGVLVAALGSASAGCDVDHCAEGADPIVSITTPAPEIVLQPSLESVEIVGGVDSDFAIDRLEVAGLAVESTATNFSRWKLTIPRSALVSLDPVDSDAIERGADADASVIPVRTRFSCGRSLESEVYKKVRVLETPTAFSIAVVGRTTSPDEDIRLDDTCDTCGTIARTQQFPVDVVLTTDVEHLGLLVSVSGQGVEVEGGTEAVSRVLSIERDVEIPGSACDAGGEPPAPTASAVFSIDGAVTGSLVVLRGGVAGRRAVASLTVADPPGVVGTEHKVTIGGASLELHVVSADRISSCELVAAPAGVQVGVVGGGGVVALSPGTPTATGTEVDDCALGAVLRVTAPAEADTGTVVVACADSLGQAQAWSVTVAEPPMASGR